MRINLGALSMDKLTLRKLYTTGFCQLYWKLLKNEPLSKDELGTILAIGLFFIGLENKNFNNLGYRLFLMYSKTTQDYKPLYELSLNKGLIPIAQFIDENLNYTDKYGNIQTYINCIHNEDFKQNGFYKTIGQFKLYQSAIELNSNSQIIVAPTSYGKTELILSFLEKNITKKICIISPTKSLLAQTKKRIINALGYKKIITYPEMYHNEDREIIAILTQERLLRLLQNVPTLKFDLLIIDEAHNLLENTVRSIILSSVIIICNNRNPQLICKYLTPFLKSKDSLLLKHMPKNLEWYSVTENVKSEIYYFYDLEHNHKKVLDQYSGTTQKLIHIETDKLISEADIVINNCANKNIIYLNNPKQLELFADELNHRTYDVENDKLKKAANDLREYVHKDYKLANYIEKGIIYHHGSIPEPIRYFIEDLYINIPEIKMLITNSTLLEGVNIPATKMFILDPSRGRKYLSPSSFRNLVGRVCRFGEIFNHETGNLNYLLPEIHIIKGKYCRKNFNVNKFIRDHKLLIDDYDNVEDELNNPLLINTNANYDTKEKADELLENLSATDTITDNYKNKPKTQIGKLCFENSVNIFNILEVETSIASALQSVTQAHDLNTTFLIIDYLFFSRMNDTNNDNLKRLKEPEAQAFYKMLINWRIKGLTMQEMANKVVKYWNDLNEDQAHSVFVGKWGDSRRRGHAKYWTDITQKSEIDKVNLAIVRLKEEYDFIDTEIIKYVEILNALDLIKENLYLKIKYGTDDQKKIALLNCGISSMLSNLLHEKYNDSFDPNIKQSTITFSKELIPKMIANKENGILITEVKMNSVE